MQDGTIFFDVTDHDLEGYNKFVPYYLIPKSVYSVGLSKSSFRAKVSWDRILGPRRSLKSTWRDLRALRRRRACPRRRDLVQREPARRGDQSVAGNRRGAPRRDSRH